MSKDKNKKIQRNEEGKDAKIEKLELQLVEMTAMRDAAARGVLIFEEENRKIKTELEAVAAQLGVAAKLAEALEAENQDFKTRLLKVEMAVAPVGIPEEELTP